MNAITDIKTQLKAYKKKYYSNILLKGSILFIAMILTAFLTLSSLEFIGNFNKIVRGIFFFSFISIALFSLIKWIIIPIKKLINLDKELSDEEASRQIGKFFPEIKDKLLNTLQLHKHAQENALIQASIHQKTAEISHVPFTNAVDYSINKKYLKYFIPPVVLIITFLLFVPQLFSEGAKRILQYERTFISPAPFDFLVKNQSLKAFKNEDFTIQLKVEDNRKNKLKRIPKDVFVVIGDLKRKMKVDSSGKFSFKLEKIKDNVPFYFSAAGYESVYHEIEVIHRPQIQSIITDFSYPSYLKRKNESLKNTGSFSVPEGTQVSWKLKAQQTEKIKVTFNKKKIETDQHKDVYTFQKTLNDQSFYEIELFNEHSKNVDNITYNIQVVKDRFPTVRLEAYQDTVLYSYILLGGALVDDYGLSQCKLYYRIKNTKNKKETPYQTKNILVAQNQTSQKLFYQLDIKDLNLSKGETLEYYVKVWDNDGVNGAKSSISQRMYFAVPTKEEVESKISENNSENSNNLNKTLEEAQKLKKKVKKLRNKIKSKKQLSWTEKKELQELLDSHQKLEENLKEMQENFQKGEEQLKRFEKQDQKMQEKVEQIQQLMEEVLDEETKKLMQELQKMLEENKAPSEMNKILEDLEFKNEDMENELERTLELYKQLKFEQDLKKNINDLKELAEKQEKLAEETNDKNISQEELEQKQEELNKELDEAKKKMEDLQKSNEELKKPNDMNMEEQKESMKNAQNEQQKSQKQLQQNQRKKASKSQKKAAQEMKKMAQQMASMQQSMEMEQQQENMDDLRAILDNLLTLSFDQEDIMKGFKRVRQADPNFIKLSQQQLKLKDDAQIIEDSLLALAGRVFELQSFVTKELGKMQKHMQKSSEYVKMRKPHLATKHQQYNMTSINNLALLLNDVLKQMQEQMAQQMEGNQTCQKPGGKKSSKNLGKQQQQLNQMIQQLKNGQKTGRQLSEQLAKTAAQQESIRRQLQEMRKGGKLSKELGKQIKALEEQMEETELDLVRKRVTEKTLRRQQEIQTRLLEAEKAAKERDEDNQREANTAQQSLRETPPAYEEYLKKKEQQIELLKTIAPSLNQYYKKEVNEYFNNLEN